MSCGDQENVYADAQYINREVIIGHGQLTNQGPAVPGRNAVGPAGSEKRSYKNTWRIVAVALGVITIVLLGAIIALIATRTETPPVAPEGDTDKTISNGAQKAARSCVELRKQGSSSSGIYMLQPDESSLQIEVYCDMETDGGGWSLVASIHESDIQRKCYTDDLWSSYVPERQTPGKTSWDNEMTFGTVQKCVENDYKNLAYYSLNASDLMIWHVQLGFHVDHMRARSTFRYRTTDKFLQKYGGNLKSLYEKYYPLEKNTNNAEAKILNAVIGKSDDIISEIPDWYNYPAGTGNSISDTSMYNSYGSQIQFRSSSRYYGYLTYGKTYRSYGSFTTVKTSVAHKPFILISNILNEDGIDSYYDIQVYSYGKQESGYITIPELEGSVTQGNYVLQYKAVQFYDPAKNTPCEMFFIVTNTEDWDSSEPSSFRRSYTHYYRQYRRTTYRIEGYPKRLVFGYILLARKIGRNFTTDHLNNVSRVILQAASNADSFEASSIEKTLTVPVVFDKGNTDEMMNTIPPDYRSKVEVGYLQFRAYNYTGYPNAICPGIKVGSNSPEYVCIGGISGDEGLYGTCGDFAGWGGKSTDTVVFNQPSGSAHSHKDTLSTILLFYR